MMAPIMENQPSGLLSNEENGQVFKLVGNRCQTLCTTIAQLYSTQPPHHSQWIKKCTGVLCFVKDNIKKNFFFRLFCLKQNMKLWEHEMYNNMDYIDGTSFFHMFEAEDCLVAFNFANVEEAKDFRIIVEQKIHARKRKEEKRTRHISQSQTLPSPTSHVDYFGQKKTLDPTGKLNKGKRNITKADIGIPRDFKHVSHIGWNSASGFDINTEDEMLRAFFIKAGVSEQQLQDKSTREYIYDFIDRNGVRDVVAAVNSKPAEIITPPAVPPRGPARAPHFRNAPPPPVPVKQSPSVPAQRSNSAPRRMVPPKKPPPAPVPVSLGTAPPAPPAPPPPPPMGLTQRNGNMPPPAPPPPTMDLKSPATDRNINSTLLQDIRNGTTLRPVEEKKSTPVDDSRGDLLSEIRQGCKLKPVNERDVKPVAATTPSRGDDLASALARALAERSKAIHSEDDDDNSNDSTDEEWED